MFRNKKDVDRHVQEVLRKVKSENERNLRCYNIAQQYYKVRDFDSAKKFLSMYLSVKEDSPLAHKLQGQICEGLGDKARALNAYKTSLEYDANQPELVLKMCELLCEAEDVMMDTDRAHYWCERGGDLFPHDPAVFRLREKLLKQGGKGNTRAFEDLINSEMKARPNDVNVRTRLMRLYLETGRTKEAFNHAVELEASQTFRKELAWYECFAQVCQAYTDEFPSQVQWHLYFTWVSVLDKVASLSMSELSGPKKLTDCVQAIFRMDQVLFKAAESSAPREHSDLYRFFIRHMSAQLCLHIATLILKRAKKEPSNWREVSPTVSPVLFLALSPPPDTDAPWCLALRPNHKQSFTLWVNDAFYRVSQAGYVVLALAKDSDKQYVEKVTHTVAENWRDRTFQRIFTGLDHRAGSVSSYLVNNTEFMAKVQVKLPTHNSGALRTRPLVPVYEKVRDTLHHLVWLGLEVYKHNDKKLPSNFHTYGLTRLKLTTHDLSNVSPETICMLDVDAFLYASVLCAAASLEDEILHGLYSSDRPMTLPADISNLLCTQEQINWWTLACQVNNQQFSGSSNLIMLRQQLQRGLEVVRVNGNHGLDVQLIVKLARTFAERAASVTGKKSDQTALENRAHMYWSAALPMLERMERNKAVCISNSKLFDYRRKEISAAELSNLLEEGRLFVACQLMKADQHDLAIESFKPLRSPHASFNMAMIYKKLAAAELEVGRPREEITSEMRSKHVILLSKARECLVLTSERIRIDRQHPLHATLPQHIAEVEAALSRIEPDPDMDRNVLGTPRSLDLSMRRLSSNYWNRSDGEANISELSVSSVGSPAAGDMGHAQLRVNGRTPKHSSTPRRQHNINSEYRRPTNNGDLVDVGQLLQIQSLHEEIKKIYEKLEMINDNVNELRRDVNKFKPPGADDLYMFGEDEEYPEDVLNGQYPPTFVPSYPTAPQQAPTFYPPPARGVQGTSTVTYGAPPTQQPPVIPLIPMRMSLDPALAFYNQGALPFPESQHIPDFLRQTMPKPVLPQQMLPPPPVNVVITTSDTLPTGPPPVQPTLSVTIPPQHRLGTLPTSTPPVVPNSMTTPPAHQFQIAMPATATVPNLQKSPIVIPDDVESEDDNEVGYDPCPNFQPIIPLPNEVNVMTGEEDEDVLLESRAKLFRFVEKEWKERGIGVVKILRNRASDKARLLMRRDQVHKVCANHLLKSDMELSMLKNSDRALVWVANDFAEETVQLEKFCIKFKTPEEALKFKDIFNDAKIKYGQSPLKPKNDREVKQCEKTSTADRESRETTPPVKVNVGGFTFISPPKISSKEPTSEKVKSQVESIKETQTKPSPFATFTFTPQKAAGSPPLTKQANIKPTRLLFAGLDTTQNKHGLYDSNKDSYNLIITSSPPSETGRKNILKESLLSSVVTVAVSTETSVENKNKIDNAPKPFSNQPVVSFPSKSPFSFAPQVVQSTNNVKDTPKSILKDLVSSSTTKTAVNSPKIAQPTKHVLFQDSTNTSPSQETPSLLALLQSPRTPTLDFAAISKMSNSSQFSSDKKSGFEGAGSTVFGNKSSGFQGAGSKVFKGDRQRNDSEGENAEEFVPSAEFKPVVPLPELIEVKTGEEGQEVLFNERAKLMRFDADNKEWKERGLGQMKILKDPKTGITRFLMRRDQVHKVCCNHRIIQSLELRASSSSEKAWTWYAVDYSEGESKNELFAIRFKTVDLAVAFKDTVDKVQKQLREEGTPKRSCPDSSPPNVSLPSTLSRPDPSNLPKLSELFRPKAGSWECKACYTVNGSKESRCMSCDSPKEKPKSPVQTPEVKTAPSLVEMFKPKAGSWECVGCLIVNDADKSICVCCCTPKPGHESDAKESPKSAISFGSSSFSFGIKPADEKGTGFNFGMKPIGDAPKSSFTFGINKVETDSNKAAEFQSSTGVSDSGQKLIENKDVDKSKSVPTTGFTFGQSSSSPFTFAPKTDVVASSADSTTPMTSEAKTPGSMFKFGNLFGDAATTPTKTSSLFGATTEDTGDKFAFGKGSKFEFNFSGVKQARSPSGSKSPSKSPRSPATDAEDSEADDVEEEEGDHLVFQPVVPLPDKVPLTTGEEDEEVLYSHRAKLYRFYQGEWKERGVGDIKILRHSVTHKIRLLMRREPILKICLNHFLTAEQVFRAKDDRSLQWSAQDYAEGELKNELFCLRLKTPEIANEFKNAVHSAQGEVETGKVMSSGSSPSSTESHDVEVVYETSVSEELRQAALKLLLPPNFYSYLDRPPCPGCAGCEYDSEVEEVTKQQVAEQDTSKQQAVKPDTSKQQAVKPDTSKQQAVKPDTSKQQVVKPDVSMTRTSATAPGTITTASITTATAAASTDTEPDTTATTTSISQPLTFTFKTTAPTLTTTASVFGGAKKFATPTVSSPLLPTPTAVQSNFSFSFSAPSAPKDSSAESAKFLFGGSASQPMSGSSTPQMNPFYSGSPLFQGQPIAQPFSGSLSTTPTTKSTSSTTQSETTISFGAQNTPSLFGASTASKGTPLFNSTTFSSPSTTSVFGGTSAHSPTSVFGTPTSAAANTPKGSLFFNNISSFQTPQSSMFGGTSPASVFGTTTTQASTATVGEASEPSGVANKQADNTSGSGPTFIFKQTTSFGDIAAEGKQSAIGANKGNNQFMWAGAGKKVFGGQSPVVKERGEESGGDSGGEEADSEQTHDPFFEPIVPLPDAIEVRTGEEDEEREFCERAKFYRYDDNAKMWKERGTGEMKILRHKETATFRLLLRREQVHKVVCNQLITAEMELQTMANSDKAFCWAGMNMAEEYTEPRLEKVAVRFKNTDIAEQFKDKVEIAIVILKTRKERGYNSYLISDILDDEGAEPEVTVEEVGTEYSEGEDGEYCDLEEVEDCEPMFEKRATLYVLDDGRQWARISQGELSLVFNTKFNAGSIVFKKDNAEHLVISAGPESDAQEVDAKQVAWCGQPYSHEEEPRLQQYKAEFCTPQAAEEFLTVFKEVMEISQTYDTSYLESEPED